MYEDFIKRIYTTSEGITDGYEVRFLTSYNGPVVQLVRISACHAEGHEFESRLDR